ncbi:MAG: hypothetical protein N2109_00910 [Fimbriimonadales bacterium]|nr:hypothetical protein [Fimbriimonadales bacterium]
MNTPFDEPRQEAAPEEAVEERQGSAYLTKKDLRAIGVVLAVLFVLMTPIYIVLKRQAQKAECAMNCKSIQGAMLLYMEVWDNQFPPAYASGPRGEVLLFDGKPFTWASTINEYMSKRAKFRCPAASAEELVIAAHPYESDQQVPMSYGMYLPRSTAALSSISDPARSVLIAETSNRGARGTYDPHPLLGLDGKPAPYDGFAVGWDTGNRIDWYNTTQSSDMPKAVTRLAFYNTASGDFQARGASRHDGGIHVLFVDGHIETVPPTAAAARYLDVGGDLTGLWSTR